MVIFFQSDYAHVVLHVSRNDQTDITDVVPQHTIYKVCYVRYKFDHPVRVGSLAHGPLKYIRFLYSFQENLESVGVRDQTRFVEVSTTAVTRAVITLVSVRYVIPEDEAITYIKFKSVV